MVKDTLNELLQLKACGFGQPQPRHGLDLLYWFARDYIEFRNGDIIPKTRPQKGDFGFHKFHNRIEDDSHIVPLQDLPYYEVGNLYFRGADDLPIYVRTNINNSNPDHNKDRIIVRLDGNIIERVYITEHSDQKSFDNNKTYRVSKGLLQIIKNTTREQYLNQVSNPQLQIRNQSKTRVETPPENNSWCTIL